MNYVNGEPNPEISTLNPAERADCERRAGRPLPTDEDVYEFLRKEREYGMREELFNGKPLVDPVAEVRHKDGR